MKLITSLLLTFYSFCLFGQLKNHDIDLYLDLHQTPLGSDPVALGTFNNFIVFEVKKEYADELWVSDGTNQNTYAIHNDAENDNIVYSQVRSSSSFVYFVVTTQSSNISLYRSNGKKSKPELLLTLPQELRFENFIPTENGVYYITTTGCSEYEQCHKLHFIDHNNVDTEVTMEGLNGISAYSIKKVIYHKGKLVFAVTSDTEDFIYTEQNSLHFNPIFTCKRRTLNIYGTTDQYIFYHATKEANSGVWSSDLTTQNFLISGDYFNYSKNQWQIDQNKFYIINKSDSKQVWVSNGLTSAIHMDLKTQIGSLNWICVSNGNLFFDSFGGYVYDGVNDIRKLTNVGNFWYSFTFKDVTFIESGSEFLMYNGGDSLKVVYKKVSGGPVYFALKNDVYIADAISLHKVNTMNGELIKIGDLKTSLNNGFPTEANDIVFFNNLDSLHHEELWAKYPDEQEIRLVKDINVATNGLPLSQLAALENKLFISSGEWNVGENSPIGLYTFDTQEKTINKIYEKENNIKRAGEYMIVVRQEFQGDSMEIYSTKGMPNDFVLIGKLPRTLLPNTDPHSKLYSFGNKVLISHENGIIITDGTKAGTFKIADVSIMNEYLIHRGIFYFNANGYHDYFKNDHKLWRTDGTASGTYMIFDGHAKNLSIYRDHFMFAVPNYIYFVDNNTHVLKRQWLVNVKNFFGTDSTFVVLLSNNQLGTFPLNLEKPITNNPMSFFNQFFSFPGFSASYIVDGRILMANTSGDLYSTDGTTIGTKLILKGFEPSSILYKYEGAIYFRNDETGTGPECWVTNGTIDGTYLIEDLYRGKNSSGLSDFLLFQDQILFLARHRKYGGQFYREVFVLNNFFEHDLTGIVFHDINNNGIKDSTEVGVPGIKVRVQPAGITTTTNSSGHYYFELEDVDAYYVELANLECWSDCNKGEIELGNEQSRYYKQIRYIDIPVCQITDEVPDVKVDFLVSKARCNLNGVHTINVYNEGCIAVNGKIEVHFDAKDTILNQIQFFDSISKNYTFIFDTLKPNQNVVYNFYQKQPNESFTGDTLRFSTKLYSLQNGEYVLVDSQKTESVLRCAFDPNDKLVSPSRPEPTFSNFTQFDEKLRYTIRFQNTGNDTAYNVTIIDTLSPQLDFNSVTSLYASHNFISEISEEGIAHFYFKNIYLVDSTTNERESQGFISFTIQPLAPVKQWDSIFNTGFIYFDMNKPVVTNTVKNTFVEFLDEDEDGFNFYEDCNDENATVNPTATDIPENSIDEDCDGVDATFSSVDEANIKYNIFPNPTTGNIVIYSPNNQDFSVTLFNLDGEMVKSFAHCTTNQTIELDSFQSGIYVLRIIENNSSRPVLKKVVKL